MTLPPSDLPILEITGRELNLISLVLKSVSKHVIPQILNLREKLCGAAHAKKIESKIHWYTLDTSWKSRIQTN